MVWHGQKVWMLTSVNIIIIISQINLGTWCK